ncbi:hypothetical protein ES703_49532 [subsurface metagenome]
MDLSMEYIAAALEFLIGDEDTYWCYFETDPDWWQLRLWTRRN